MNIHTKEAGAATVIHIEGDFISELDQKSLKDHVKREVEKGAKRLVIDLGHVKYMNSCGLGSLVCALTTIRRSGGELRLAAPGSDIRHLFEMTRLDMILKVFASVDEAVK